jgi:UPF0271 protein
VSADAIALNADLGEGGEDAALYPLIDWANVACGGHAGDERSMTLAVLQCRTHAVALGAHPSYPDRDRFGRVSLSLTEAEIADAVHRQVSALAGLAREHGGQLHHVKPHGALYADATRRPGIARAVARGAARVDPELVLVGLARSRALEVWREEGFRVAAEGFADRAYEQDGTLRPRDRPGALLTDPGAAAAQALRLAEPGDLDTLCVHSDTEGAVQILEAVRAALRAPHSGGAGGPSGM